MSDVLVRIKRLVLAGRYEFSEKARIEMKADSIIELDVAESILNAVAIYKTIRSTSLLVDNAKSTFTSFKALTWKVYPSTQRVNSCAKEARKLTTF